MAIHKTDGIYLYIGLSSDVKPTAPSGSRFLETDTKDVYVCIDDATWTAVGTADGDIEDILTALGEVQASPTANTLLARLKTIATDIGTLTTQLDADIGDATTPGAGSINTRMGEVQASPTANTVLARLKDIVTALADLGYEFTINGINFNGYAKIKTLTLDDNAYDDHPITLHDATTGLDYQVPVAKVFITFQALAWNEQIAMVGRIGESDTADTVITKEVLKLANGTLLPFMTDCYGVFTAGKFVTAESSDGASNYTLKSGSTLYGVEIDA